jgi:hypothetical protein
MKTYAEVVNIIQAVAKGHQWIKTVEVGDVTQRENKVGDEYPLCFINYDSATVRERTKVYSFGLLVCDQVTITQSTESLSNQLQVLSDCESAITDIINYLVDMEIKDITIQFDQTLEPFTSGFLSGSVGWVLNFSVTTTYNKNSCDSMIKNVVLPEDI